MVNHFNQTVSTVFTPCTIGVLFCRHAHYIIMNIVKPRKQYTRTVRLNLLRLPLVDQKV